MVRRLALIALFSFAACRSAPSAGPKPRPLTLLSAEEARSQSKTAADALWAIDLAWLYGNDRATARTLLDAALAKTPNKAPFVLRRALLAELELDRDLAFNLYLRIIENAPQTPEAEFAIIAAQSRRNQGFGLKRREAATKALLTSKILEEGDQPITRTRVAELLVALAHEGDDLKLLQERIDGGGFIRSWRSAGPLAPFHDASFQEAHSFEAHARWSQKAQFRGHPVKVQLSQSNLHRFDASPGERPGLFVHDTWVRLEAAEHYSIVTELTTAGRIAIDGHVVIERDLSWSDQPEWMSGTFKATPGWHRITLTVLSSSNSNPFVALLNHLGQPAAVEVDNKPRMGNPPSTPFALAKSAAGSKADTWLATALSDPNRALWGRIVGARFVDAGYGDRQRALQILGDTAQALPESAMANMARASLAHWRTGTREAALEAALKADPTLPSALASRLGQLLRDEPDRALPMYERLKDAAPTSPTTARWGHRLYSRRGWRGSAAQFLNTAGWRPGDQETIAQWLMAQDWMERASKAWNDVFAGSAHLKRRHQPLLALRQAKPDEAIRVLAEGASWTDPARAYLSIAEIELGRRNYQAAHAALAKVDKIAPLNGAARRLRLQLAEAQGDVPRFLKLVDTLRDEGLASLDLEIRAAVLRNDPVGTPRSKWLQDKLQFDVKAAVKKPDTWPNERKVLLLERSVDMVNRDGSSLSIEHRIQRLKTKEATDEVGELSIQPEALLMAVRTHKKDGRTIDADRHAGKEDLSFSAMAPGDAVELKQLIQQDPATPWGGYVRRFQFQGGTPAELIEYVVVAPKDMEVVTHSYHGAPQPTVHEEGDQRIYHFEQRKTDGVAGEAFAVSGQEYLPLVVVYAGVDQATARAANMMAHQRQGRITYNVREKANELARQGPRETLAQRIFDFVEADIDEGSESDSSVTLTTGRGDRTKLYVALARAAGIRVELARLRPVSHPQLSPPVPDPSAFSGLVVRVTEDNHVRWVSFSSYGGAMGKLPPVYLGGSYLVMRDGRGLERAIPDREVDRWPLASSLDLVVDKDGNAKGTLSMTLRGGFGFGMRSAINQMRLAGREPQLYAELAQLIPGAKITGLDAEGLDDRTAPLKLTAPIEIPAFMVTAGEERVMERLLPGSLGHAFLRLPEFATYQVVVDRKTPLMLKPTAEVMHARIRVLGAKGEPRVSPQSFARRNQWFVAEQAVDWEDQTLVLRRSISFNPLRVPVAEYPEFKRRAETVTKELGTRLVVP